MQITINGQKREIAPTLSLQDVIAKFCVNASLVIAEHNGSIVKSPFWPKTTLCEGDVIELVTYVGGG
jgi:thiamine biosynthesis protein ThiS